MEKTTLGVIAALGVAAIPAAANASAPSTEKILNPTSVAELLDPVGDAVATLDALQSQGQLGSATVADATVVVHHHHHHHHTVIIRHRHHHHHHHTVIIHHD